MNLVKDKLHTLIVNKQSSKPSYAKRDVYAQPFKNDMLSNLYSNKSCYWEKEMCAKHCLIF